MKVTFIENLGGREVFLIPYDQITRIPFSITIDPKMIIPEMINCRILSLPNFIEFSFERGTNRLYSISCISLGEETIIQEKCDISPQISIKYFDCILAEADSVELSQPISIVQRPSSIQLNWNDLPKTHYHLNSSISLGVDEFMNLSEIVLLNLDQDTMKSILGH